MKFKENKPFSPSESHSYNVNVAMCLKSTGKATLLKEFFRSHNFWERQEKGMKDGVNWFFLRMDKLDALYPEYSKQSMYRWIKELEGLNLIASRNDLNKHGYDRTRWFTVNVEGYDMLTRGDDSEITNSQNENSFIPFSKWRNAILKMNKCNSQNENSISQNENCYSQNGTTIQSSIKVLDKSPRLKENSDFKESQTPPLFPLSNVENKREQRKKEMIDGAIKVVDLFNELLGRKVDNSIGSKNVEYVLGLRKKVGNYEDIELMVKYKVWEWKDDAKMRIHLKPITIFKRHGERYTEEAKELSSNEDLAKKVKESRDMSVKGKNKGFVGGDITRDVAERLKNW